MNTGDAVHTVLLTLILFTLLLGSEVVLYGFGFIVLMLMAVAALAGLWLGYLRYSQR